MYSSLMSVQPQTNHQRPGGVNASIMALLPPSPFASLGWDSVPDGHTCVCPTELIEANNSENSKWFPKASEHLDLFRCSPKKEVSPCRGQRTTLKKTLIETLEKIVFKIYNRDDLNTFEHSLSKSDLILRFTEGSRMLSCCLFGAIASQSILKIPFLTQPFFLCAVNKMFSNNANKSVGYLNYNNLMLAFPFEVFRCLHSVSKLSGKTKASKTASFKSSQVFLFLGQFTLLPSKSTHLKINKRNKWLGLWGNTYLEIFQWCSLLEHMVTLYQNENWEGAHSGKAPQSPCQ